MGLRDREYLIKRAFIVRREKGNTKKLMLRDTSIILTSRLEKHSRPDKKIWLLLSFVSVLPSGIVTSLVT